MGNFGKFAGGALGWVLGGPLGALAGVVVGSLFDTAKESEPTIASESADYRREARSAQGDFQFSLLVLASAVMKADGQLLKAELNFVKQFLLQNFGEAKSLQYLQILKELQDQQFSLRQVCLQINQHLNHANRLQLLYFLYGIAASDSRDRKSVV